MTPLLLSLAVSCTQLTVDTKGRIASPAALRLGTPSPSVEADLVPCRFLPLGVLAKARYGNAIRSFLIDTGSYETVVRPSLAKLAKSRVEFAGRDVVAETSWAEGTFDRLGAALKTRVDGVIGIDMFRGCYLGLDPASECVGVFDASRGWDEVADLWFGSVVVREGPSVVAMPWSSAPQALDRQGGRRVRASVASRDTLRLRSARLDPAGRIEVPVRSGSSTWRAVLDTGSTLTIAPKGSLRGGRGAPLKTVTPSGIETLSPAEGTLLVGAFLRFERQGIYTYSTNSPSTVFTIGLDLLKGMKFLADFESASLEVAPYVSASAGDSGEQPATLYHAPSRRLVTFRQPASFPYESGWYLLRGKAVSRDGWILVNGFGSREPKGHPAGRTETSAYRARRGS